MFTLDKKTCKLLSVNARAEKHGKERVPAYDLKLAIDLPNTVLDHFHAKLNGFFFKLSDQMDIEGEDREIELVFPQLESPFNFNAEFISPEVIIEYGIDSISAINMGECIVNKFKFYPKEGGTVGVGFRVIAHPSEDDVGKICSFIQRELELTIK
jgi:hypothetical protein